MKKKVSAYTLSPVLVLAVCKKALALMNLASRSPFGESTSDALSDMIRTIEPYSSPLVLNESKVNEI